jgi:predicted MPP superfamily phosphohydrolase
MKVAYISDLHLEFVKENIEKQGRPVKMEDLVRRFLATLSQVGQYDFLVIAGDISHSIGDLLRFLRGVDAGVLKPVYVVLGNHDFWNWKGMEAGPIAGLQSIYDKENYIKAEIASMRWVRLLTPGVSFLENGVMIIGDCGFAAFNWHFNYRHGIYRGAIKSGHVEKELSNRWRTFYDGVIERTGGENLLVITHMPHKDWGLADPNPNAFYICGHIHDADHDMAEIRVTDRYRGDAANGYFRMDFEFKILEIGDQD